MYESFCFLFFLSVTDLRTIRVGEIQAKVVSLQQVQMATHHVQQSLAFGKFLLQTCIEKHVRRQDKRKAMKFKNLNKFDRNQHRDFSRIFFLYLLFILLSEML